MNLKYIENISNDNKEATVRMYGRIGGEVNGALFAEEMRYLANFCEKITMRINSEGGSVLEGYTILDAMNEIKSSGKCEINTHNSGMAASMASVVLCNGMYRTADNYSITMIHNAHGDNDNQVLNAINQSIQTIYKDRTRLNGDVAASLMDNETFMNTDMAMEYGFIDEVIQTGKKVKMPKKKSPEALAQIFNELITPKTMNKVTALLGLKNEASEEVIVESVEALKKQVTDLEAEKTAKEEEIKTLKAKIEEDEKAEKAKVESEATALVENAITKKLIKEEDKDKYVNLAKVDNSAIKSLFETLESANTKAKTAVNVFNKDASKPSGEDRENWTIIDWQKKDSKGLLEIQNTTPEVYKQMYDNYYVHGIGKETKSKK